MLVWGVGSGVGTAALGIAKALGARVLVTSSSDAKLERALRARRRRDRRTTDADVVAKAREATGGAGMDIVVEHVGEATWKTSLQVARPGGRIVVCGATTGPNPPAQLHRIWWKQLSILGSTMGTREDFAAVLDLVASGRAKPIVDACSRWTRRGGARAPGVRRAAREGRAFHPVRPATVGTAREGYKVFACRR